MAKNGSDGVFVSHDGRRRIAWSKHTNTVHDAAGGKIRSIRLSPDPFPETYFDYRTVIEPNRGLIALPVSPRKAEVELAVVDIETRRPLLTVAISDDFHRRARSYAFSSNGDRFVLAEGARSVRVWDTTTWRETVTVPLVGSERTGNGWVNDFSYIDLLRFSPEGRWLVARSFYLAYYMSVDLDTGAVRPHPRVESGHPLAVGQSGHPLTFGQGGHPLAFGPGCQTSVIATSGRDPGRSLSVIEVETGRELMTFITQARVEHAAFSPDGRRVATISGSEMSGYLLEIWSVPTGQLLLTLAVPAVKNIERLVFRTDGKALMIDRFVPHTADAVFDVQPWDASDPADLRLLQSAGQVSQVAFSPNGRRVIGLLPGEGGIVVWELTSGQIIPGASDRFPDRPSDTSPDGRFRLEGMRLIDLTRPHEPDNDRP